MTLLKQCNKCGEWKDYSEFYKNKSAKDGLTTVCKSCRKVYDTEYRKVNKIKYVEYGKKYRQEHQEDIRLRMKEYRKSHKEVLLEQNKQYQSAKRKQNKEKLYQYKSPCAKCGESRSYVIDFHHIDPSTKLFNISTMGSRHTDIEISDEVKKCVCLCRNCHQEYHHFYGRNPKNPVETLEEYLGKRIVELLTK